MKVDLKSRAELGTMFSSPGTRVMAAVNKTKAKKIEASVTSAYVKIMGHDVILGNGVPEANLEALKEIIAKSPMGEDPIGQDIIRACVELQVRRAQERMNASRFRAFIQEVDPEGSMFDLRS